MLREGYIMQEITSYGNISEAFDRVLRGKKRKRCRQGRYLLAHREEVIAEQTAKSIHDLFLSFVYKEAVILVLNDYSEQDVAEFVTTFINGTKKKKMGWQYH